MDRFEKAGRAFERLCRIMARLRAPGGCPWDAEQTLDSLKPYLIEEAYEVLEAIEREDVEKHREELGDLLLQVVFQAEVMQERPSFDITDVVEAISDKLLRRHPHVFGSETADDATGALRNWETVKAQERTAGQSVLDGIPPTLPALLT
jgi:MazG family protein